MKADVKLELFLDGTTSVLEKHIELLKAIEKTGSITKAAKYVGISYKNAWDSLNEINNASKQPLIIRPLGNTKNSGSKLSEFGKKLVDEYEIISAVQQNFLKELLKDAKINLENLKSLQHIGVRLSARNKLLTTIDTIDNGAVMSRVVGKLSSGEELISTITLESCKNLDLKVGDEVLFIFKAPSVILSRKQELNISSNNILEGVVEAIKIGAVNAEVIVQTKGHQKIAASVTKEWVMHERVGVGEKIFAIIPSNEIIIGF
ncbi:TOBE domain-containing protein [uncultured Campylobacter sp.]|uniref:TOBE domain-containing protein n=1 Tax=uncultured Campylobacter sp. TaxID=218934 RepID=UPI00260A6015|nr:TOBE domain-containing protein [uncultured Campylobacter sp.]